MIIMIKHIHYLLSYITGHNSDPENLVSALSHITVPDLTPPYEPNTNSNTSMYIDGNILIQYIQQVKQHNDNNNNNDNNTDSTEASLVITYTLLCMQYIHDILKSSSFQQSLTRHVASSSSVVCVVGVGDNNNNNNTSNIHQQQQQQAFQRMFLKLSDQLLQLYAFTSYLSTNTPYFTSGTCTGNKVAGSIPVVIFFDTKINLTLNKVGHLFSSYCFEVLKCIQELLDLPTFIAIFQVYI